MCPGWNMKHMCASRRTVRTELMLRADVRVVAKDLRRRESEGSWAYKGRARKKIRYASIPRMGVRVHDLIRGHNAAERNSPHNPSR